mgnify:CR=1 FL=1
MKSSKKVSFSKTTQIFEYDYPKSDKLLNRKKRRKNIQRMRQIRNIERYMHKNKLLFTNEYLSIHHKPVKHIRGDSINFISRKNKWITSKQYLKIIC